MKEITLFLIKPDSTAKNHAGAILKIIEEHGFVIQEMRMLCMDREFAERFYTVHKGKVFYEKLIEFMTSGKTVAAILQKENAIENLRKIVGKTDYHETQPETIRRIYGETVTRNAVHASDSIQHAKEEIAIIFPDYKY
ncbi:MAG: nucleoside-diphosphate kinase [Candidatus Cloacimonetes bacterium]|nr:nucleoside-diphosphate kinase [Candidatus Cloacimonadota bacterium]